MKGLAILLAWPAAPAAAETASAPLRVTARVEPSCSASVRPSQAARVACAAAQSWTVSATSRRSQARRANRALAAGQWPGDTLVITVSY